MRFAAWVVAVALCGGVAVAQEDLDAINTRVSELHSADRYAEAIPLAKRSLELTESRFGKESTEVATRAAWLGFVYESQGKYAEAEPLYKRALAMIKQHPFCKSGFSEAGHLASMVR